MQVFCYSEESYPTLDTQNLTDVFASFETLILLCHSTKERRNLLTQLLLLYSSSNCYCQIKRTDFLLLYEISPGLWDDRVIYAVLFKYGCLWIKPSLLETKIFLFHASLIWMKIDWRNMKIENTKKALTGFKTEMAGKREGFNIEWHKTWSCWSTVINQVIR